MFEESRPSKVVGLANFPDKSPVEIPVSVHCPDSVKGLSIDMGDFCSSCCTSITNLCFSTCVNLVAACS